MREFVEHIVKFLVDEPDEVLVTEKVGESTIIFVLKAGKEDTGKIIGKHGQNIKSLRMLVTAICAKQGKRMVLELVE